MNIKMIFAAVVFVSKNNKLPACSLVQGSIWHFDSPSLITYSLSIYYLTSFFIDLQDFYEIILNIHTYVHIRIHMHIYGMGLLSSPNGPPVPITRQIVTCDLNELLSCSEQELPSVTLKVCRGLF